MSTSAGEYLQRMGSGRHPDLPETTAGTVRLDIREDGYTDHWYLTIDHQHVEVSRSGEEAELVVRADREAFDRLASGQTHLAASLLRNELTLQGDIRLLMMLRRIFPGPSDARNPHVMAQPSRDTHGERDGRR